MTKYEQSNRTATPTCDNGSDKHCVFRCGKSWFSIAADVVREITIAPTLVPVPQCHPALTGLCHLRSEFVPVLALDALLDVEAFDIVDHNKLMVIEGRSVWAMRIAEAAAIESLETLVAPEARLDDGLQTPVIGTAMFRDSIARVLDPNGLVRLAQKALEDHWHRAPHSIHPSRCEERSPS